MLMPKIIGFILADDVMDTGPNSQQVTSLVNPRSVLRPQYVPSAFSFAFSISIRDIDLTSFKELKLIIKDPKGNTIQDPITMNMEENPIPKDPSLPSDLVSFTANVSVRNIPLEMNGIYQLNTYINDKQLEPQEIPVFVRSTTFLDDKLKNGEN